MSVALRKRIRRLKTETRHTTYEINHKISNRFRKKFNRRHGVFTANYAIYANDFEKLAM